MYDIFTYIYRIHKLIKWYQQNNENVGIHIPYIEC